MAVDPTKPLAMSFSQLDKVKQCGMRWKLNYVDGLYESAGIEAVQGSFVHQVFESMYSLPHEQRVLDIAESIADLYLDDFWEDALEIGHKGTKDSFYEICLRKISNLWKFEDPTKIDVWAIEYEIKGVIEDVIFKGYADRIDSVENDELMIVDYKSGAIKGTKFYAPKIIQIVIYACMLREQGLNITRGRYIHLETGVIDFYITDAMIKEAKAQVKRKSKDIVKKLLSGEEFTANTGALCAWCTFSTDGNCPKGAAKVDEFMRDGMYIHSPAAEKLGHSLALEFRDN